MKKFLFLFVLLLVTGSVRAEFGDGNKKATSAAERKGARLELRDDIKERRETFKTNLKKIKDGKKQKDEVAQQEEKDTIAFKSLLSRKWKLPPLTLLKEDSGKPYSVYLKQNAQIIKSRLDHFGVPVEM